MVSKDPLLAERLFEHYGLRSLFFYKKLNDGHFQELYAAVSELDCSRYPFEPPEDYGLTQEAIDQVNLLGLSLCHVFCHPVVIKNDPKLIAYYRGAAALSQKAVQQLSGMGVSALERGTNKRPLAESRALILARMLNRFINSVVLEVRGFDISALRAQVLMTAGAQADGSWRQVPGQEASDVVKLLIIGDLQEHGCLQERLSKEEILQTRSFTTVNGYRVVFSSEPDISFLQPDGVTEAAVVEVKGGVDSAGALERYGAAKKSFDDALSRNSSVITVYLAAVITPTVANRISADRAVRETYNLTAILADEGEREKFLNQVFWWLHLSR